MNKKAFNKFDKPAHQLIKPEKLVLGDHYAFNLNPKHQPNMAKCHGFAEWYETYISALEALRYATTDVIVEVSSMGRFHFHGEIIFKGYEFYWRDLQDLCSLGTVVVKPITDPDDWHDYVNKQQHFMSDLLKRELFGYVSTLTRADDTPKPGIVPSPDPTEVEFIDLLD